MANSIQSQVNTVCYNKQGCPFTYNDDGIRDKHNNILYKVTFQSGYITYVQANKITTGTITDYMSPSVYGFGCPDYPGAALEPEYYQWLKMISRCYDKKYLEKYPSYKECSVASEWAHYRAFKRDLPNICNYQQSQIYSNGDRLVVDKDILIYSNKIYSPSTCCIVPEPVNIFITNNKSDNTSGYIGVHKRKNGKYSVNFSYNNKTVYGGTYDTARQAVQAYYFEKSKCLDSLIARYPWIDDKVKVGLANYLYLQNKSQIEKATKQPR